MKTKLNIKHLIRVLAKKVLNHTIYKLIISLALISPCNYYTGNCGRAEYYSGDECCPVCSPGKTLKLPLVLLVFCPIAIYSAGLHAPRVFPSSVL